MTGTEYRALRIDRLRLTQDGLALALDISRRKVVMLEAASEVPRTDEMALRYLVETVGAQA